MESGGVSPLNLAFCYFEQHASLKIGKLHINCVNDKLMNNVSY